MKKYLEIMKEIYDNGNVKGDRTGTGTKSIFGTHLKHDLREGFPLLTTKSVAFRLVAIELLWFISGSTNIKFLVDNNCHIWDEWAVKEGPLKGELGPVYGSQWRNWKSEDGKTYDQIAVIMNSLKNNPNSRRHIVSGWNVPYLPDESKSPEVNAEEGKTALPPCHLLYQFYVANGVLSSSVYIRSNDYFLGNPFNMASLALLTHMLAQQLDLVAGEINVMTGDTHLYSNHMDQAALQLARTPTTLPTLKIIRKPDSIFDYKLEDFVIENYVHQGAIKAPISK